MKKIWWGAKIAIACGIIAQLVFCPVAAETRHENFGNIDFVDADLFSVVEILAEHAGLNLVAGEGVRQGLNKRTTLHLKNITYHEALQNILRSNGLEFEIEGQSIIVVAAGGVGAGTAAGLPKTLRAIRLQNLEAAKAIRLVRDIYPQSKCVEGAASNEIVLEGRPSEVRALADFLVLADRPQPQVLIESKVAEVSSSGSINLGFRYASEGGVLVALGSDIAVTLSALESRGEANILARPNLLALDGVPAEINIGSKVPYAVPVQNSGGSVYWRVEYLDAGVKLDITPKVLEDGLIQVEIEPEVSAISEWRVTAAGEFPVITTRNVKTKVRVRDGETIVIGGLLSNIRRNSNAGVPFLAGLPVLGWFFQAENNQQEKSEIIFMITPQLLKDPLR